MNCFSIYSMLLVDPTLKIFILDNCTSSLQVISSVFSSTIQYFEITIV